MSLCPFPTTITITPQAPPNIDLLQSLMEITVGWGNFLNKVNCPLDMGSQRSFLSDTALDVLNCHSAPIPKRDFVIKTFLGFARKILREIVLCVELLDSVYSVLFWQTKI